MATTYTWKIDSIDKSTGHMAVEFTHGDQKMLLNLPIPPADADIHAFIDSFAPRTAWVEAADSAIEVGMAGSGNVSLAVKEVEVSEAPNMMGDLNEEYLRAMIYTVLEEIQESTV